MVGGGACARTPTRNRLVRARDVNNTETHTLEQSGTHSVHHPSKKFKGWCAAPSTSQNARGRPWLQNQKQKNPLKEKEPKKESKTPLAKADPPAPPPRARQSAQAKHERYPLPQQRVHLNTAARSAPLICM